MTTTHSTETALDGHPTMDVLPHWPDGTIGVLATTGDRPYAIPVTAPERTGNRQVLLNLHRTRGSLQRLRRRPEVALLILSSGNIALTAHGSASVVAEAENDEGYATVLIEVDQIHDHRQPAFRVESGVAVVKSG